MANERNKILPYALSAIEGVNIQSQEDYIASTETSNGVSTGLANGNNFNKLAKQVSIMSSSLAEFIVDTLSEQTISDTNSIEEISSALNNTILKLIKDNEPVIPDQPGVKVIDDNTPDITSFNQITKDGIYYVYKKLSDAPAYEEIFMAYTPINLMVINIKDEVNQINMCIQLTSINVDGFLFVPSNIGVIPMMRSKDADGGIWSDWFDRYGIVFTKNNIVIEKFIPTSKSEIRFPIIAKDSAIDSTFDIFMYSATKEQMREQLGITDEGGGEADEWTVFNPTNPNSNTRYKSMMYKITNRKIGSDTYRLLTMEGIVNVDVTITNTNLYGVNIMLPDNIKLYNNGFLLKNGSRAVLHYYLHGIITNEFGGTDINVAQCYSNKINEDRFSFSYTIFGNNTVGKQIKSASLTFHLEALIDDRQVAPTPKSIAVTKIQGNSVTLTYTRGE